MCQKTEPDRWEMDRGVFRSAFPGREPAYLSRAPGRVNLIGEHTDYNGLPVFPMALRQEVRVLFTPRLDGQVRFMNPDAEFPPREFTLSREIPRSPTGDWGNYLKAACQALVRRLGGVQGMDAVVTSTVPVASGLSSSSALVIAVGRALLRSNDREIDTLDLAEEMARAERYTGTQGGGMDQAISLGAVEGNASRIEFDPLSMHHTPVPPGWRFVVAHTLVRAEKSGGAQAAYNRRREECREALSAVGPIFGRPVSTAPHSGQGGAGGGSDSATATPLDPDARGLTYRDLMADHPVEDLLSGSRSHLSPTLFKRFRHVITEAARVYDAEAAMRAADLQRFGTLMTASHRSLREDYEVSSPELDRLVELALDAGAAGARLTGAGFGGCAVALTDEALLEDILTALRDGYFLPRGLDRSLSSALFRAEAAGGSTVMTLV